jgi:hypothetical protein
MIEDAVSERTVQEANPKPRRYFIFNTWKVDFYTFAVDLEIEPGLWIIFSLRTGKRIFKWEWTIHQAKGVKQHE